MAMNVGGVFVALTGSSGAMASFLSRTVRLPG